MLERHESNSTRAWATEPTAKYGCQPLNHGRACEVSRLVARVIIESEPAESAYVRAVSSLNGQPGVALLPCCEPSKRYPSVT
jgi:hypothetical protein